MSALWVAMHNVSAFPTVVYDHPWNCPFKDTPRAGCIIAHKERFFHLAQSASGGREVNESMFDRPLGEQRDTVDARPGVGGIEKKYYR